MRLVLALLCASAAALAQPVVTAVLDGAAYTNNIAQGSIFVVKGTGLSASGTMAAPSVPYPAMLNNGRISLTPAASGTTMSALIYRARVSARDLASDTGGTSGNQTVSAEVRVTGSHALRSGTLSCAPF